MTVSTPSPTPPTVLSTRSSLGSPSLRLTADPRRRRKERAIRYGFLAAACVSVAVSALIVITLATKAFGFLHDADLSQLWSRGWFPRRGLFDLRTLFIGSLIVTGVAMVVAAPIGLGVAIWLSEYASRRARKIIKPIMEILAGVPSVVVGFFALTWIIPRLVHRVCSVDKTFSLMGAGLGVGLLIVPLIASVAEDAMRAVPTAMREASYGLGARKVTTSLRVVVPAAMSGIVAALILAVSRAIGETMVIALAAGGSGGSRFTTSVCGPGQTLTGAIASLSFGSDQVAGASTAYQSLFFVGLVLFVLTLGLNMAGNAFIRRTRQKY